jgi:hypothetical protein
MRITLLRLKIPTPEEDITIYKGLLLKKPFASQRKIQAFPNTALCSERKYEIDNMGKEKITCNLARVFD